MTSKDYDLNLWEPNSAEIPAVQGETLSRTVNIHLKEEANVQNALGNLEIRPKPVDVTGYSIPRMYITKSDGKKTFFDGTITDATNGIVSFVLPYQATTAPEDNAGTVYLTKPDGSILMATGINIHVKANNLDSAIESTDEFPALVTALNKTDAAAATATQAAADGRQAVTDAQAAIAAANQASGTATKEAQAASSAADKANQAASDTQSHYQMINPLTGKMEYITDILRSLENYIFGDAISAQAFDNLNLTAQVFDAKNITARDFDSSAKTLLGAT